MCVSVYFLQCVVCTSASNCLERCLSEMILILCRMGIQLYSLTFHLMYSIGLFYIWLTIVDC